MVKAEDWQIVLIVYNFVEEVDCNSGKRRRVWKSGTIEKLNDSKSLGVTG